MFVDFEVTDYSARDSKEGERGEREPDLPNSFIAAAATTTTTTSYFAARWPRCRCVVLAMYV